jgi:hypothetical protein
MEIRLDVNKPRGKKPVLVGIWIEGWGWVMGGCKSGDLVMTGDIVPVKKYSRSPLKDVRRLIRRAEGIKGDELFAVDKRD